MLVSQLYHLHSKNKISQCLHLYPMQKHLAIRIELYRSYLSTKPATIFFILLHLQLIKLSHVLTFNYRCKVTQKITETEHEINFF